MRQSECCRKDFRLGTCQLQALYSHRLRVGLDGWHHADPGPNHKPEFAM